MRNVRMGANVTTKILSPTPEPERRPIEQPCAGETGSGQPGSPEIYPVVNFVAGNRRFRQSPTWRSLGIRARFAVPGVAFEKRLSACGPYWFVGHLYACRMIRTLNST
jgi:hypothetical protein